MTERVSYELLACPEFLRDLERLDAAAEQEQKEHGDDRAPEKNRHRTLLRETLQEMRALRRGASNGHHVLGQAAGYGDGRDAVASKVSSGPGPPTDRLIFREIPARNAGGGGKLNARELLVAGPRHGPDNAYRQAAVRLGRDPGRRLPELDRFGSVEISTGGKAKQRNARLDAQRAIAYAYDGQVPLAGSRPLSATDFGSKRTSPPAAATNRPRGRGR